MQACRFVWQSAVKIAVKSPAIRLIFNNKKLLTVNHGQTSSWTCSAVVLLLLLQLLLLLLLLILLLSWVFSSSSYYYYFYPGIVVLGGLIGFSLVFQHLSDDAGRCLVFFFQ